MNFANITDWIIPEGSVERVTDSLGIVIWQKQGHDYSKDSFYVENATGSDNTLTIKKYNASAPTVEVFKSTDTVNWTSMGNTDTTGITATIPAYGRVYLRATASRWCGTDNISNYNFINCSGNFRVGGNIMSLLKGTAFYNTTLSSNNTWAFASLFHNYNNPYSRLLVSAKDLILPSNTADYCYYRMFSLCYYLTETPVLPATTMTTGCYNSMFSDCTSLTTAPVLPATTLANDCYRVMFRGCSALTTAPVLPATILVENCYLSMFWNCTSLNQVTTYANDITATDCISSWLSGVAATGTFDNRGSATYLVNSASGIPTGWTEQQYFYVEDASGSANTLSIVKNNANAPTIEVFSSTDKVNWTSMGTTSTTSITATVPANGRLYLKATANQWGIDPYKNKIDCSDNYNVGGNIMSLLAGDNYTNAILDNQYTSQFDGLFDRSLTLKNVDKLLMPINVTDRCYQEMFYGCTGLTTAPALPATTLAQYCYQSMFRGCSVLTTVPVLPATTLAKGCYNSMFLNCSALTTAPALPATTLAERCYGNMFQNCTSLTTAPALPATTLADYCYSYMFQGCTGLTAAPVLPATILANNCYQSMFRNCTGLTTAPALPATTLASACYNVMFDGCTNLNNVTTYANDISATNCLNNWLQNVSATGDFYNLGNPAPTYPSGTSGIPTGWTEHNSL